MAPFGLPHIRLVWLLFSAGTVFFSHNISVITVFFLPISAKIQQAERGHVFFLGCCGKAHHVSSYHSAFFRAPPWRPRTTHHRHRYEPWQLSLYSRRRSPSPSSVKFYLDEFTAKDNVRTKYEQPAGGVAHPRPA